jgi:hypothetical protein
MDESTKQKVYDTHRMWLKLEKAKDMKITEQTKIKDLIPKGYEVDGVLDWSGHPDKSYIEIVLGRKKKTFEDYKLEYSNDTTARCFKYNIAGEKDEIAVFEKNLSLLWYIIKDRGGDIYSLIDLLYSLADNDSSYASNDIAAEEVWDLLPKSFIESFKEE